MDFRKAYLDERIHIPLHIICGQKSEEGMSMGTEMAEVT